jgi:hypothetical protein
MRAPSFLGLSCGHVHGNLMNKGRILFSETRISSTIVRTRTVTMMMTAMTRMRKALMGIVLQLIAS